MPWLIFAISVMLLLISAQWGREGIEDDGPWL